MSLALPHAKGMLHMNPQVSSPVAEPVAGSRDDHVVGGSGRYLYAVVAATDAPQDCGRIGLEAAPVYAIVEGGVAAIVSDIPNDRIRPQRRHLAAHQQVLRGLMEATTPLPMSFGHIADGPEAIRNILQCNQSAFVEQLQRVEGKVEMGLRVSWDVPNIFEYFIATHPRLRDLRDRLFRAGREPSPAEKIELGRTFDLALKEDRVAHTQKVRGVLQPVCCEVCEGDLRDEREVMNLACLVARDAEQEFERAVFVAAGFFDNRFSFDYNGPWPPYNFVSAEFQI